MLSHSPIGFAISFILFIYVQTNCVSVLSKLR